MKKRKVDDDNEEVIEEPEVIEKNPMMIPQPSSPTADEWIQHQLTHLPFRSWCPICIQAKGKNPPHRKRKGREKKSMPTISIDYMFMNRKPNDEELMHPILVIKDDRSGGIWALPTDRKGRGGLNIVPRIVEVINSLGYGRIILKSDQENSIVDLSSEVRRVLWKDFVVNPERSEERQRRSEQQQR